MNLSILNSLTRMIDYLIFATCFAIFLIIAVLYLYKSSKIVSTIPGPEPIDLLEGNLADIKACGSLHQFLLSLHKSYGEIACFWYGPTFCVSLSTPKLFKEFSSAFNKPYELHKAQIELWGDDSISVNNGVSARKKLAKYSKFFSPDLTNKHLLSQKKIIKNAMVAWSKWPKGTLMPLHENIFKLCLECFSTSFFGMDFLNGAEHKELFRHLKRIWVTIEMYSTDSRSVDVKMEEKFQLSREYLYKLVLQSLRTKKTDSFADVCQTSNLNEATFICDTIACFTDAVFKITSLCSWACYYVSKDKKIQEILREYIKTDEDKVDQLDYMNCVLLETMRCQPIVTHTSRFQEFETIVNGHKIPEGTPIINAIGVHFQNPDIFTDPTKFNPERIELKTDDLSFTPFGFSKNRECPAKGISMEICSIILSEIFSAFQLDHSGEVQPQFGFYTRPADEMWVSLTNIS